MMCIMQKGNIKIVICILRTGITRVSVKDASKMETIVGSIHPVDAKPIEQYYTIKGAYRFLGFKTIHEELEEDVK